MRDCVENIDNDNFFAKKRHKQHYRRPIEYPFKESELRTTTIIFGGLTWKHEILLKASFENLGYLCDILPNPDFESLQIGKEFCDPGLCNPVYFTFGALIKYLKKLEASGIPKEKIIKNYVYLTAGSCGPCRFGMYESQFRIGLNNAGYNGFRVIIFQQNEGLDQVKEEYALKFNHDFFLRILGSFILADILNDVAYQYRPYEIETGSVDKALKETIDKAYLNLKIIEYPSIIKKLSKLAEKQFFPNYLLLLLKIVYFYYCKEYNDIPKDFLKRLKRINYNFFKIKPIVKVTGEFWAQTTESDGNLNMHRFLEQNNAQVIPEPLSNWIMYILHQNRYIKQLYISNNFKSTKLLLKNAKSIIKELFGIIIIRILEKMMMLFYNHFRKKLNKIPFSLPSQDKLRFLSKKYYNPLIEGGEGHLEIGKTLYYSLNNLCHMVISLKPFGCMPSTMSDGIMSSILNHNNDVLFSSIETGGEGIINMYSRVLMTLNEAKEKAKNEFEQFIKKNNIDINQITNGYKHYFFPFRKKGEKKNILFSIKYIEKSLN